MILVFNYYSKISRIDRYNLLGLAGRASYHIYLVQMLYFGFQLGNPFILGFMSSYLAGLIYIVTALGINIMLGIAFYKADSLFRDKIHEKFQRKTKVDGI